MPWFLFLIAGGAVVAGTWRTGRRIAGMVTAVVLFGLAALSWPGVYHVEKMLTDMALPIGLVWFLLLVVCLFAAVRRHWRLAAGLGLIWLILSLGGSYGPTGPLIRSLERPYYTIDPMKSGRFDAVCLLGGGAWVDRNGRSKVTDSGDRIVVAARLYHAGQAPIVLCSGDDFRPAPNLPTASETSADVLVELGVPRQAILLGGGLNTKTEMIAIGRLVEEHGWSRIGIVTSAWHMRRVERLAREAGVEFEPLPADFRSGAVPDLPLWEEFRRFSLVPNAGAVELTHAAFKEYLARVAGR